MHSNVAALPRIVECARVLDGTYPRADFETLAEAPAVNRAYGAVTLYRLGAGYEIAGSAMRLNASTVYGVRFYLGGSSHGRRYASEADARAHFAKLTQG